MKHLENDRKHQNEMKDQKDRKLFLSIILVISFFASLLGLVFNAVGAE